MRYELPEVLTRVAFKVDFYRGEDGWWIAECEDVPGAVTQGETLEEAREMIRDALGLMLGYYSEGEKLVSSHRTLRKDTCSRTARI